MKPEYEIHIWVQHVSYEPVFYAAKQLGLGCRHEAGARWKLTKVYPASENTSHVVSEKPDGKKIVDRLEMLGLQVIRKQTILVLEDIAYG
jgi:hypothetical protein